ncbi:hypothetical protein GGX14DRAFT_575994 [Mycena pura]|uniref:Uncharacterized protein n=1 Tax=Mycena pura TaxID=153505 RepID=A0AAD6Y7N3_9AGAR|nr:hypothetical protein GGX14DRAFT_575994 [Mycena pura]
MSKYHLMTDMSISPVTAKRKSLKPDSRDVAFSTNMSSSALVFNNGGSDFLGAIIGGMVWSAYAVLFFWFLTLERKARPDHKNNTRRFTYALTALFCIATLNCAVDFGQGYLLLVPNADPTLVAAWRLSVGSTALLGIVDFLSQMILIYRCWIVWNHNYYVVSPVVFFAFASLAGQVATAGVYGIVSGGEAEPVFHITVALQTTAFSLSMAVNTLVTGLIVSKIWVQSRQLNIIRDGEKENENETRAFNRAITLMIESGLMNFIIQLLYLVLNVLEIPAFSLMETCAVHFYGITPTLLGIRVITGKSIDSYMKSSRSLAFASGGGGDTTASIEMGGPGQQSSSRLFDSEFASKEVTIVGKENV